MTDVAGRAQDFLIAAFAVLREQYVIPRPRATPFIAVGTDYFGGDIRALEEHKALEQALEAAYPGRFRADPGPGREFASTYITYLLQTAVALSALDDDYTRCGRGVICPTEELLQTLNSAEYELMVLRVVSHLRTPNGEPVSAAGVDVIPETEQERSENIVARGLPGAGGVLDDDFFHYDPPHAVLRISEWSDDCNPEEVADTLNRRLSRFMLCLRLLHASTAQSLYEVWGINSMVPRLGPQVRRIALGTLIHSVRRTTTVDAGQDRALTALGDAIEKATALPEEGAAPSSFSLALGRFQRSFVPTSPFDQLQDLSTCLEGLLIAADNENEGLSLRLCSRAAALLATDADPPDVIFSDIKVLYGLRSKIVHGARLSSTTLSNSLTKVSTVPTEGGAVQFADRLGHGVDRLRDLVRRAALCRLGLSLGDDPLWPLSSGKSVDAELANEATRAHWQHYWHAQLAQLGAGDAGAKAPAAVGLLTPPEHEGPSIPGA